jgi:UDP-glucuronate decarboxylase
MPRMPPEFPGPVNLGNEVEFTIRELAEEIIDLTGSSSKLVCGPLPEDDPRQRRPDAGLARAKLGWQATTSLRDGLRRTIDYFETLLKQEQSIVLGSAR